MSVTLAYPKLHKATEKDMHIYRLIMSVAPQITAMFPEMHCSIKIRVGGAGSYAACWRRDRNEVLFSRTVTWTLLYVGEVLGHELTHAFQDYVGTIPSGEKATDLFNLVRLPLIFYYHGAPSYLDCSDLPFKKCPRRVQVLARQAVALRKCGYRCYIKWFEDRVRELSDELKRETA